jgi:hypothetical protein
MGVTMLSRENNCTVKRENGYCYTKKVGRSANNTREFFQASLPAAGLPRAHILQE